MAAVETPSTSDPLNASSAGGETNTIVSSSSSRTTMPVETEEETSARRVTRGSGPAAVKPVQPVSQSPAPAPAPARTIILKGKEIGKTMVKPAAAVEEGGMTVKLTGQGQVDGSESQTVSLVGGDSAVPDDAAVSAAETSQPAAAKSQPGSQEQDAGEKNGDTAFVTPQA
ncbi:hypothetical protein QFC24_004206 [Naganishia onofrii]|uniref:Uncharacterized protein n=1 Tax=Naganishia onofrii TaxID=1851511 RepID=A0ACC2XHA1_9TREE|nr:hypothetical protein QFC24_004206 [Naganishia onofrii]